MTSFFEINKYQSISMTFKIETSQYYDLSESKHGNDIFRWNISKSDFI